jgi:hypothetical protein
MDRIGDGARQAYAVVRLDDHGGWTLREAPGLISLLKVVSSRDEAEAEADALNAEHPAGDDQARHYVVLPTWVY